MLAIRVTMLADMALEVGTTPSSGAVGVVYFVLVNYLTRLNFELDQNIWIWIYVEVVKKNVRG